MSYPTIAALLTITFFAGIVLSMPARHFLKRSLTSPLLTATREKKMRPKNSALMLLLIIATTSMVPVAFGQIVSLDNADATNPEQTPVEQQLIAADRAILAAMSGAHPDMAKLAHLLGPEYADVEPEETQSREEVLKVFTRVTDLTFQYENPRAAVVSPTAGYVIADVHYTYPFNGTPIRNHKLTTTLFTLRQGEWVATLHTEMPVLDDREDILAKPEDSVPDVIAMRKLAAEVMSQVHVAGYGPFPVYAVSFDAGPAISFSNSDGVHEADFSRLPSPMQQIWTQWASYTKDEPSGDVLFKDMFYRFTLVHELGHLIVGRVIAGMPEMERKQVLFNQRANLTEGEFVANRIAVAWFREHDPQYLARLVNDYRLIQARMPNPVPPGADAKRYLSENYLKLSSDPVAYGWYQLYMVYTVYDEAPKTFQQTLDTLPKLRYNEE